MPETEEASELHHEPPDPQIRGHASSEAERHVADLEEEIASDGEPEPPASGEFISIADKLRDAVTQALYDKGHETASALLRAARWQRRGQHHHCLGRGRGRPCSRSPWTSEAERIARTALQQAGSNAKLVVLAGRRLSLTRATCPHAAKGSIQSHALDNPLVKQAQELFRAEVQQTYLDLRGKP